MKNVKLRDSTGPKPDLTPQWFFTISYLQPTITVNFHHIWLFLNLQFPGGQSATVQVVLYATGLGRHTNIPDQICQRVAFAADWNNAGRNSDVIKLKLT